MTNAYLVLPGKQIQPLDAQNEVVVQHAGGPGVNLVLVGHHHREKTVDGVRPLTWCAKQEADKCIRTKKVRVAARNVFFDTKSVKVNCCRPTFLSISTRSQHFRPTGGRPRVFNPKI